MAVTVDSNIYFTSSSLPGGSIFSNVVAKQELLFKPTEGENLISNQSIHLKKKPVESLHAFQVKDLNTFLPLLAPLRQRPCSDL